MRTKYDQLSIINCACFLPHLTLFSFIKCSQMRTLLSYLIMDGQNSKNMIRVISESPHKNNNNIQQNVLMNLNGCMVLTRAESCVVVWIVILVSGTIKSSLTLVLQNLLKMRLTWMERSTKCVTWTREALVWFKTVRADSRQLVCRAEIQVVFISVIHM